MMALSPPLLLATAHAFAAEGDPSKVRRFDGADDATQASALFVNHVGYHSHRRDAQRSFWPFALTASCDEMAEEANRMGAVHQHLPGPGELLLKWSVRRVRFIGVGIVVAAWNRSREEQGRAFRVRVCVGSAQLAASANGPYRNSDVRWAMIEVMDALPDNGDRFIDWTELDARDPSRVAWRMPFRTTVSPWRKRRKLTS
jgi:hypothetical protein